jgi:putative hemolysin
MTPSTMLSLTILLLAAAIPPAAAAENTKLKAAGNLSATAQSGTVRPGTPTGGTGGGTVAELSAQDCRNVGGKVITVRDDRCGSSGKYCRMPDTNAVCIDVRGD